jgi:ABC-2 type transport system permease protein
MRRIIHIELIKIRSNATFWILTSLHAGIILLVLLSIKFFLRSLSLEGHMISRIADPAAIPVYQFPDIWQNIAYIAAYLKFILAIYVIISITNELAYNTLRQNIMNGLSIKDFIGSKLVLVFLLSLASTVFLFFSGLVIGILNTPELRLHDMIKYSGFIPAYFLLLTAYLIFALMIGLWIKRTGLAMGLLFLYTLFVEPLVVFRIGSEWVKGLFPLKAFNNLVHMPFGKYILREIQDYVAVKDILIVLFYCALFLYFIYLLLRRRDL